MSGDKSDRSDGVTTKPQAAQGDGLAGIALTRDFLDEKIRYYDREARRHSLAYHVTKAMTIIVAAVIPFVAGRPDMAVVTGLLGVVIVILQGLQQLFNVHENWIRYRSTCEALRNERFLYGAKAGLYAGGAAEAERRLAEQVGAIVRQEYSRWATVQLQPATGTEKAASNGATTEAHAVTVTPG
jgi:hypothetical protein